MDSQVKERIVGAAVLVALGVWLIPWVLDGQDEPSGAPAAGNQPVSAPLSAPLSTDAPLPAADQYAPVRTETVELTRENSERQQSSSAPPQVTESAPEAARVPSPADRELSAAAETPGPGISTDSPAAIAATAVPAERAAVRADTDDWIVQLGAFSDPANARQLASRVNTYGYSALVSEYLTGGRTMHRVRIGGFESRNGAEVAASSLAAHGFPARVVSPE